eukprot:TRINITY_DN1107_c0_g1_i4.p3 TRINITY_DN1107_c0_g1~~TRINITY_DN1107_c0_g1_i4.p3  ORF type:complete len:108 (-),score=24.78 TRINITY_DN1107_c0_g1_i4:219-542(-)
MCIRDSFGGFFLNSDNTPVWLEWVPRISPFRYGLEALVWNEFDPDHREVLPLLGFSWGLWECIGLLAALGFAFRFLALFFLKVLVTRVQQTRLCPPNLQIYVCKETI